MTASAIIMMIVAIITVWGGLAAAIVNLTKRGEVTDDAVHDAGRHREP